MSESRVLGVQCNKWQQHLASLGCILHKARDDEAYKAFIHHLILPLC